MFENKEYQPHQETDLIININYKVEKDGIEEVIQLPVRLYTTHDPNVYWSSAGIIRLTGPMEEKTTNEIRIPLNEIKIQKHDV